MVAQVGLGSRGDNQGVIGAGVLGLGRDVSGGPGADLVKDQASSGVLGWVLGLPGAV